MRALDASLLSCVVLTACGGADAPEVEAIPAGLAVTDLSDSQIAGACQEVPVVSAVCGAADVVPSSPAGCVAGLEGWRTFCENRADCPDASEVAACWAQAPCDRYFSGCAATPPDPDRCWTIALEDCDGTSGCQSRPGYRYDPAAQCFEPREMAYCAPAGGCSNAFSEAKDDAGGCWGMPSICDLPPTWTDQGGCPAFADSDLCP